MPTKPRRDEAFLPSIKDWPAESVERMRVSSLIPYARNARTHSEAQVSAIARSIEEFGWTSPALVDENGGIIAGHGRIMAAQQLGIDEVPVMVARGWSEAQKRAYVLADNQLALQAGWDAELLRSELDELKAVDFDVSLTGFDDAELAVLFTEADLAGLSGQGGAGSLSDKFMVPPFSVLNAREGWWQDRKRAWLALGIQSELGRGDTSSTSALVGPDDDATYRTIGGAQKLTQAKRSTGGGTDAAGSRQKKGGAKATPGGSLMPAADYSKRQRGNGKGQPIG